MDFWKSRQYRLALKAAFISLLWIAGIATANETTERPGDHAPANDSEIPIEVLAMRIKHLSTDELTREADRLLARLKATVRELNDKKIDIWYKNQAIESAEAAAAGDETKADNIQRKVDRETVLKEDALEQLATLREKRTQIIDRLNVVLDELSAKLGTASDDKEQEAVLEYRRYADSVKGIKVDVTDTQSTRATIVAWLKSSEGGLRWAKHIGEFAAIIISFWVLSILLGKLVGKLMAFSKNASQILRKFVVDSVRRIVFIIGLLFGLAALEINITPLVAVIGAAGFVIAFALQNTLSNFASGLMIMAYKPFDIGDFVESPSASGKVKSMTLVTTNMMTPDNKLLVVPNNELWGKVITNVTGSQERRVDLVFGIGYGDDITQAERVIAEVLADNPRVLKSPEPVIRVAELADSSVNLICRPWVKTPDYWEVYWELTRTVKERFDAEGISIPFPQRDVHVHTSSPEPADGK